MFLRIMNWLTFNFFSAHENTGQRNIAKFFVFFTPLLSILLIIFISCQLIYVHLTMITFDRRQTIVDLGGILVKERLDRLREVGVALATRVQFRQLIDEGRWKEAIKILDRAPDDLPFVTRIFITDMAGTEMADTPHREGAVGKNFSYRDWYKGVIRDWKPYISEVYQRAAIPRHNIIAVSVPIETDDGRKLGILVMQVKLETVIAWVNETYFGPAGILYIVDQKGHIVAHPRYSPQSGIVDFARNPAVAKVLQGQSGIEILNNPIDQQEQLTAYMPIYPYGWGVIAQQSVQNAFRDRNAIMTWLIGIYAVILIFNLLLIIFTIKIFEVIQKHRQILQDMQVHEK